MKVILYVLNQLIYQKPTISPKYMALLHKTCLVFECRIAHTRNSSTMFAGFFSSTMYYVFSVYYYILVQILQPPPHSFTIEKQACTYTKLLQDASQYKTTHCTQKHHLQPQSLLQPSATTRHQTIILFGMNIRTLMTLGIQLAQCS